MTTIPACPPIPTLDELLHSGNFVEVNVNELVVDCSQFYDGICEIVAKSCLCQSVNMKPLCVCVTSV
jgi:hypothetical protein